MVSRFPLLNSVNLTATGNPRNTSTPIQRGCGNLKITCWVICRGVWLCICLRLPIWVASKGKQQETLQSCRFYGPLGLPCPHRTVSSETPPPQPPSDGSAKLRRAACSALGGEHVAGEVLGREIFAEALRHCDVNSSGQRRGAVEGALVFGWV